MASLVETEYGIQKIFHDAEDFLPLLGTDFVEFYEKMSPKLLDFLIEAMTIYAQEKL